MISVLPVGSRENDFLSVFRKTAFFFEHCVSVNQQSQYTIRNLISKFSTELAHKCKSSRLNIFLLGQTIGLLQTGP